MRTSSALARRLRAAVLRPVRPRFEAAVERRVQEVLEQRERELTDFTFIVVVAPGRSGSTLVQGLLNEIPGTLVRGENDLYLHGLYRVLQTLRAFQDLHETNRHRQVTSPFYGLLEIKPRLFVRLARELFVRGALGNRAPGEVARLGFKEVLWHRVTPEETEDFFAFLDDAFPGVRYILNSRDPEVTVGSGFWKGQGRERALEKVVRVQEVQQYLRESRGDRTYDVRYETITGDDMQARDAQLRGLLEFVTGEPARADDLAALVAALGVGYGPHPFGKSRQDREEFAPPAD